MPGVMAVDLADRAEHIQPGIERTNSDRRSPPAMPAPQRGWSWSASGFHRATADTRDQIGRQAAEDLLRRVAALIVEDRLDRQMQLGRLMRLEIERCDERSVREADRPRRALDPDRHGAIELRMAVQAGSRFRGQFPTTRR